MVIVRCNYILNAIQCYTAVLSYCKSHLNIYSTAGFHNFLTPTFIPQQIESQSLVHCRVQMVKVQPDNPLCTLQPYCFTQPVNTKQVYMYNHTTPMVKRWRAIQLHHTAFIPPPHRWGITCVPISYSTVHYVCTCPHCCLFILHPRMPLRRSPCLLSQCIY